MLSSYWKPLDGCVDLLIYQYYFDGKDWWHYQAFDDGDRHLFNGTMTTESDAIYQGWSDYVDWCYENCPIRLEYLQLPGEEQS